jgi:twitching motility two-component system response regulator PilH
MVTTPKVLVVDDSNVQCLFMRQALQSAGYQVLVANDGQEGLRILKQEAPQCLILDIVLPGMSGFELCRYIRAQEAWRTLPIVMVSTKNSSSDRFWAMRQGASQYLSKPFKQEELIKVVMEVLLEQVPDAPSPLRASTMTPRVNAVVPPRPIGRTSSTAPSESIEGGYPSQGTTGPRSAINSGNSGPIPSANIVGASWHGIPTENPQFPPTNTPKEHRTPNNRSAQFPPTNNPQRHVPPHARSAQFPQTNTDPGTSGARSAQFSQTNTDPGTSGARNAQFSQTNTPHPNASGLGNGLPSRPQPQMNNLPRSFVEAGPSHPVGQQSLYALSKFIPRRIDAPELLWSNSPEVLAITDRRARQLYMAIDSQKNIEALTAITQMNRDEIISSLRLLLSQQRINLYEPSGRLFDSSLFDSLLI